MRKKNNKFASPLFGLDDAKKTLVRRTFLAYAGAKEPEVGVFEAVFSPTFFLFDRNSAVYCSNQCVGSAVRDNKKARILPCSSSTSSRPSATTRRSTSC